MKMEEQIRENQRILRMLRRPEGQIDVVLDTDTYNEIDDQYALAFLVKSAPRLRLVGIHAAPFYAPEFNHKSENPEDGMEKSYEEILRVLRLMEREDLIPLAQKGSREYMKSETEPVESPAARRLVELAMEHSEEKPLYVLAIGAITNVASALLMEPEIKNRLVLVWLGGNAYSWPDNKEFNLFQDVAGARVVFGCGVPLVQLPCMGVVSAFTTTGPELEHWLRGKNKLCDYLADITGREAEEYHMGPCWSRAIWDVTAVGWLLGEEYMRDRLVHSPIPEYDHHYSFSGERHLIRCVYFINRDALFHKLFTTLAGD